MHIHKYTKVYQYLNIICVFSRMPPKTKGKQVNIYFPQGLYDEMVRVMEKANAWMNAQEFVRDAVKEKSKDGTGTMRWGK